MGSLADKIKAAQDIKREPVECPEWGVTLWVADVGADGLDAWEASNVDVTKTRKDKRRIQAVGMRARLVIAAAQDEQGNQVFTEADASWLGKKSSAALDRCFDMALRLAGKKADEDDEDGPEKNSVTASGSGTASPSPSAAPTPS